MNKAQITGQVFIYIMVMVVVGLLVIVGYIYGNKIITAKCVADRLTLANTIEVHSEKFDGYNEVQTRQLVLPCNTKTVCLVDSVAITGVTEPTILAIDNPTIINSVKIGAEQNIFLVGDKNTEAIGYSAKIRVHADDVEDAYVCLNRTGNRLNIRYMGDSDYSYVETFE